MLDWVSISVIFSILEPGNVSAFSTVPPKLNPTWAGVVLVSPLFQLIPSSR